MHYLIGRENGRQAADRAVSDLLRILRAVPLDDDDFRQALAMGFRDFEDAVQVSAAVKVGADFVVTRNAEDFRGSPVPVRAPGELLVMLSEARNWLSALSVGTFPRKR